MQAYTKHWRDVLYLGTFICEVEAARAYDLAAVAKHGHKVCFVGHSWQLFGDTHVPALAGHAC